MIRATIVGAAGRMGRRLVANVMENDNFTLTGAIEYAGKVQHIQAEFHGLIVIIRHLRIPVDIVDAILPAQEEIAALRVEALSLEDIEGRIVVQLPIHFPVRHRELGWKF